MFGLRLFSGFRILAYHSVPDIAITGIDVTKNELELQFQYLKDNGYEVVSLREIQIGKSNPEYNLVNKIVLTFDDGYDDFLYNVIPLLKKYEYPATVYPISKFVQHQDEVFDFESGKNKKSMNKEQLIESSRCHLVNIGSHSAEHLDFSSISSEIAQHEIATSIAYLSKIIQKPIVDFCYPWAKYNKQNMLVVNEFFKTAVIGKGGVNRRSSDFKALRRIPIKNGTISNFARVIKLYSLPKDILRHYIK